MLWPESCSCDSNVVDGMSEQPSQFGGSCWFDCCVVGDVPGWLGCYHFYSLGTDDYRHADKAAVTIFPTLTTYIYTIFQISQQHIYLVNQIIHAWRKEII